MDCWAWALLLLNEQRSAICIDKRMPPSADKVAHAMTNHWPHLASRWDYVASTLDAIEPCSSTLLCGIHACGTLSDRIISLAIQANAPLVVIPCCHTKRALTRTEQKRIQPSQPKHGSDPHLSTIGVSNDCNKLDTSCRDEKFHKPLHL
jgi:hypothetical protein